MEGETGRQAGRQAAIRYEKTLKGGWKGMDESWKGQNI